MNSVSFNELVASNKKSNKEFNKFKMEQCERVEKLNIKITNLENELKNIKDILNSIINLDLNTLELNEIKKNINENITS